MQKMKKKLFFFIMQQMEGFGDEFMEMEASKKLETGPDFRLKMKGLVSKMDSLWEHYLYLKKTCTTCSANRIHDTKGFCASGVVCFRR